MHCHTAGVICVWMSKLLLLLQANFTVLAQNPAKMEAGFGTESIHTLYIKCKDEEFQVVLPRVKILRVTEGMEVVQEHTWTGDQPKIDIEEHFKTNEWHNTKCFCFCCFYCEEEKLKKTTKTQKEHGNVERPTTESIMPCFAKYFEICTVSVLFAFCGGVPLRSSEVVSTSGTAEVA